MHVSYETPTWDTCRVWDPYQTLGQGYGPLEYLLRSQNGNGGWGLQRGGDLSLGLDVGQLIGHVGAPGTSGTTAPGVTPLVLVFAGPSVTTEGPVGTA
jgi:hypothetical protein